MGLIDKLAKIGSSKYQSVLSKSKFFDNKEEINTEYPAVNIVMSGEVDGGFTGGLTILAGPSKHFKSNTGLVFVEAYMRKYPDSVCIFYDSEFGSLPSYFSSRNIDTERVLHVPIEDIEQMKFDLAQKLTEIEKNDRIIIFVDSVGNLASKKEVEDAENEKSAADMTRAKQLKSLFRIITPKLKLKNIPCIVVGHTYKTMETYAKDVLSGGTGIYYSADTIIFFGRSQEKDDDGLQGFNFTMKVDKSRRVREQTKVPLNVTFKGGINKMSGMFDLALEGGFLIKPKNGWYQVVDKVTGETSEKSYRASEIESGGHLEKIVYSEPFKEYVRNTYLLVNDASDDSEVDLEEIDEELESEFDEGEEE